MLDNRKNKILIVDDEQINIDLLKNALKESYKIYAASNGEKALQIIPKIEPDILLLDIMMPGIDGYITLERLKKMSKYKEIPVIFLTALNEIKSKEKGFELGAVDYITKPFEVAEIKARVKTHLELVSSKKEVQLLLSKTLSGSVQMLLEVLSTANPTMFNISTEIKEIVKEIVKRLEMKKTWKYEIAAMLSHIGCFMIKDETLKKLIKGESVSLEEEKAYSVHPALGAKLISKIPRLRSVAEIVANQAEPIGELEAKNEEILGSQILEVAEFYILSLHRNVSKEEIIIKMRNNNKKFNIKIVEVLEKIISSNLLIESKEKIENKLEEKSEKIAENIKIGMIIDEDIYSISNRLVVKRGAVVNELLIEHLNLLEKIGEIKGKIKVLNRR